MQTIIHTPKTDPSLKALRWAARIIGTLTVAFTLFMLIGSFIEGYNRNQGKLDYPFDFLTTLGFVFWGIGLLGLVIAWWREGLGGMLSLGAMIIFIALVYFNPASNFSIVLVGFLLPPVLYVAYWLSAKGTGQTKAT